MNGLQVFFFPNKRAPPTDKHLFDHLREDPSKAQKRKNNPHKTLTT